MLPLLANNKKTAFVAISGTIIEWYDFALLGAMAPIMATLFFPDSTKSVALLNIFLILAVGLFSRILGAVILGHMGDKYGRLITLLTSIAIVSITTLLMALLPTYQDVGVRALIFLVILRIIQGFGLGGENAGGITLLYESSNVHNRIFRSSLGFLGVMTGTLFGFIASYLLVALMSMEAILDWGWRIPYLIGGILGLAIVILRYRMSRLLVSSKSNSASQHQKKKFKPIWLLVKKNRAQLLVSMGLFWHATVMIYVVFFFIPAYLEQTGLFPGDTVMLIRVLCMLFLLLSFFFIKPLSHRYTGVTLMKIGALGALFLSIPLLILVNTGTLWSLSIGMVGLTVLTVIYYAPVAAVYGDLFSVRVRYTGISLAINMVAGVFGGTAPALMTLLASNTGSISYTSIYLMLTSIVGIYCLSSQPVTQSILKKELNISMPNQVVDTLR